MTVYVGMDVHRKRSQVAIVDAAGDQQRNRNLANDPPQLVPILGALPPGTPVAFEAAYGWGGLAQLLRADLLPEAWIAPADQGSAGVAAPSGQPGPAVDLMQEPGPCRAGRPRHR